MKICICVMPFGPINCPNLGISLLKSNLEKEGISTRIFYFNFNFAKEIGINLYNFINGENDFSQNPPIGETFFSPYLFDNIINYKNLIFDLLKNNRYDEKLIHEIIENMKKVKQLVPKFMNDCLIDIFKLQPDIVGFTSSYHQNCSSLLLAKKIKEKKNIPIIFGGANCEGEMGYTLLKLFEQIDYICSGDGDISFIELIKKIIHNKTQKINGILTRESSELDINLTNPLFDLDILPFPNFDDYFYYLKNLLLEDKIQTVINLETSRGCWWGELSHCTFCGLNGSTMTYRSKSAIKSIEEIKYIIETYNINTFSFVDNIMNPLFLKTFFPEINNQNLNVSLFYETKSNLSKNDLIIMKKAGIHSIQPGIESFSDVILRMMKKGVTGLQNIQLLKWCRELDIKPYWNILVGFPKEPIKEYSRMSIIIPLIVHLFPPMDISKIQLSRFSPYFYEPRKYGLRNIRPSNIYKDIYPFDEETIKNIVYYFDYDYEINQNIKEYTYSIKNEVNLWKELWKSNPPKLSMILIDDIIIIEDTRPCAIHKSYLLQNHEAFIYKMCNNIKSIESVLSLTSKQFPFLSIHKIKSIIKHLENNKILLRYKNRLLSLATEVM